MNVPGKIHKRFHVELVKRAGNDPLPSQVRDDAQNPPLIDDLEGPEYEVESILRARSIRRGRGNFRQALVKWTGWAEPTWEPIESIRETQALDRFEATYGNIEINNGPENDSSGGFVGPAEGHILDKRRQKRHGKNKQKQFLKDK